jgi:hypothetical protein
MTRSNPGARGCMSKLAARQGGVRFFKSALLGGVGQYYLLGVEAKTHLHCEVVVFSLVPPLPDEGDHGHRFLVQRSWPELVVPVKPPPGRRVPHPGERIHVGDEHPKAFTLPLLNPVCEL